MSVARIVVTVLLSLGVGVAVLSSIGLALARDVFDRIHYLTPGSTVAPVLIAAAILVEEFVSVASVKAVITAALIITTGPVIGHATARAARVRQFGHWEAVKEEAVDQD
jgi:multicomponent Na+:H+ antiporter subunit G